MGRPGVFDIRKLLKLRNGGNARHLVRLLVPYLAKSENVGWSLGSLKHLNLPIPVPRHFRLFEA